MAKRIMTDKRTIILAVIVTAIIVAFTSVVSAVYIGEITAHKKHWRGYYTRGTDNADNAYKNVTATLGVNKKADYNVNEKKFTGSLSCSGATSVSAVKTLSMPSGKAATEAIGTLTIKIPRKAAAYTATVSATVKNNSSGTADKGTFTVSVPASPKYTISYNLNGGSASGNPSSYQYVTNTFTLKNPTRTGYTFIGWTGSNGSTPKANVSVAKGSTGNKSYTANWTPNTYSVIYDLNGGSADDAPPSSAVYDQAFSVDNPVKQGHSFLGWRITGMDSTAHTYGSSATTSTVIGNTAATTFKNLRATSGTVTFSAQYTEGVMGRISFDANGGDGIMEDQLYIYETTEKLDGNEFHNRGYTFTGWNTDREGSGVSFEDRADILTAFPEGGDIILYAQWKEKERNGVFSIEGDTQVRGYQFERVRTEEDTLNVKASLKNGQYYSIFGLDEHARFITNEEGSEQYSPSFKVTEGAGQALAAEDEEREGYALSTPCETLTENMTYLFKNVKTPPKPKGLKVIKKVTGDKATEEDKARSFSFSYDVAGLEPGGDYKLVKPSGDGEENETRLIPDDGGRISGTVSIRHDEYFVISGLPEGAKYNITELTGVSSPSEWPYRSGCEVTKGAEDEEGNQMVGTVTSFGITKLPESAGSMYGISAWRSGEKNDKGLGVETFHDDIEYTFRNSKAEDHDITIRKQVDIDGENNITTPGNGAFTFNMHFSNLEPDTSYSAVPSEYSFVSDKNGKADVKIILKAKEQAVFKDIPGYAEYEAEEKECAYSAGVKVFTKGESPVYETFGMYGRGVSVSNQENRIPGDADSGEEEPDGQVIGLDSDQLILFTNSKKTSNSLTIGKQAAGHGVKASDTFGFTVDFTGLEIKQYAVKKYTFDEDDELVSEDGSSFRPSSESAAYHFTLNNHQKLKIEGIPDTVSYTVTESASEGYTPSFDYIEGSPGAEDDEETSGSAAEGESLSTKKAELHDDAEIAFTNTKDTPSPEKRVSDNDDVTWEGNGREQNVSENTVPQITSPWDYTVSQKVYPGYERFEFKDTLPDNIVFRSFPDIDPSSDVDIRWTKEDGSVITETIVKNDDEDDEAEFKSAHFRMDADAGSIQLYSSDEELIGRGGTFEIILKVRVDPNSDMSDFRFSKQIYRKNERLVFTNTAETSLDENEYGSNLVKTNIPLGLMLTISKNVKGDLGDLTKEFRFTADFSGLEAGRTYSYNNGRQSFEADPGGRASVSFKLRDDEYLSFESLPPGAGYMITEAASNHFPSYEVIRGSGSVKRRSDAASEKETPLSTAEETLSESREYRFTNRRELEPVTGTGESWLPLILALTVAAGAGLAFRRRIM